MISVQSSLNECVNHKRDKTVNLTDALGALLGLDDKLEDGEVLRAFEGLTEGILVGYNKQVKYK